MSKRQQLQEDGVLPPSENLTFVHWDNPGNRWLSEYNDRIAYHGADQRKALPDVARRKKERGTSPAVLAGANVAGTSIGGRPLTVATDPKVLELARDLRMSQDRTRQLAKSASTPVIADSVNADPGFVAYIKHKHKKCSVNQIFSAPKRDHENKTAYVWGHCGEMDREPPDKEHFLRKNFYSEYTEALASQAGLQCAKK
mmetsp:Transcript_68655/g.108905  ORF Transcript_68655/g.108905 Transcript_68655/m.108905 type:complete len:199 (-) Transcript_68655:131-727(-)|eukprot:CAMPEP_0169071330 /NCGR_PEP_ID=MMETSP1015-20121227/5600_1 /TAXON_ID=342587 /ORGANISM="Karlodinium micrum, Strain CCMP2283" /LENGTH=198 /DNA_ID=CAMNT_0009130405 /DNA_START=52 /DNA_END=648 /DNA_ORIENTATION=+